MHRKMHKVYGLSSSLETSIYELLVAIYFSDSSISSTSIFFSRSSPIVSSERQNINKKEIGSLTAQHTLNPHFSFGVILCSMSWSLSNYDDKKLLVNLCLLRFAFIPALWIDDPVWKEHISVAIQGHLPSIPRITFKPFPVLRYYRPIFPARWRRRWTKADLIENDSGTKGAELQAITSKRIFQTTSVNPSALEVRRVRQKSLFRRNVMTEKNWKISIKASLTATDSMEARSKNEIYTNTKKFIRRENKINAANGWGYIDDVRSINIWW